MTADIARARAILTAVHEKATPGEWVVFDADTGSDDPLNGGRGWWWVWAKDRLPYYGGVLNMDQSSWSGEVGEASITDGNRPQQERADAEFITLMVDLYPAIDALLAQNSPSNEPPQSARDVAAAILAWAERTGYEEKENIDGHQ